MYLQLIAYFLILFTDIKTNRLPKHEYNHHMFNSRDFYFQTKSYFFQNQLLNPDSATRGYGFCTGKLPTSLSSSQLLSLFYFFFFNLHGLAPVYFTDLISFYSLSYLPSADLLIVFAGKSVSL